MGRTPCCDKSKVKSGIWSPDEDAILKNYLLKHGTGGNWIALPQKAGLRRCGKSCRLRWLNYLRPDIKRGAFTQEEESIISSLYCKIGSRWSIIASNLPGRTDNDVKNYWNTKLKKKILAANCSPSGTRSKMRTATVAAAALSGTAIVDKSITLQPLTGSLALPTTLQVPTLPESTIGQVWTFPRFILEGSSACSSDSVPLRPFSLGMDESCEMKGIPMDEHSYEALNSIWSQEEAFGADLFSMFAC